MMVVQSNSLTINVAAPAPVPLAQQPEVNLALQKQAQAVAAAIAATPGAPPFTPTINAELYVPPPTTQAQAGMPVVTTSLADAQALADKLRKRVLFLATSNPYLYAQLGYPIIAEPAT